MEKKLYPKAKQPLYMSLLSIFIMVLILFIKVKSIAVGGLFISFLLAVGAISLGIMNLRFINRNDETYRGADMCWISICLGVIALLSTLPFVITFVLAI